MDQVFKAINDPSRRLLLDRLMDDDGQTLGDLCAHLPEMTRFGVMSHLRVLEEADLITTVKQGRTKLHYLNPIPIRMIHDRWISKYSELDVGRIAAVKAHLEGGSMTNPDHIYHAYIHAPATAVWDAITNGDQTVQYFYGTRVESEWAVGSPHSYTYPDGTIAADGEVVGIDPPKRLEMTFHPRWDAEIEAEGPVRQVWLLEETDGITRLSVEYYDLPVGSVRYSHFTEGIPYIVSGLKTLLETGSPITG